MNEGLKKMEELLRTDTAFQEKLKAAMESYTGEQKEEAVFNAILVPLQKSMASLLLLMNLRNIFRMS